jgi:hypothetical protein
MAREETIKPTREQIREYSVNGSVRFFLAGTSLHDFQYLAVDVNSLSKIMPIGAIGKNGKISPTSNNAEVYVFAKNFPRDNIPGGLELIETGEKRRVVKINLDRDEHPTADGQHHQWYATAVYS